MQSLSPEASKLLVSLKDTESKARHKYAQALAQHCSNRLTIAKLKSDARQAKQEYVEAYTKVGLNRQSAWQQDHIARGLCRLCGGPATGRNCNLCRKRQKASRKKSIVQP